MKKRIKRLTALLVASASLIAIGSTLHVNNNARNDISIVKANAGTIAYLDDQAQQVEAATLEDAINLLSQDGGYIVVTDATITIDRTINISSTDIYISFNGNCALLAGSSLNNGSPMFNLTNGATLSIYSNNHLTIGSPSEESSAKFLTSTGSHLNLTGNITIRNFKNSTNGAALNLNTTDLVMDGIKIRNCSGNQGGAIWFVGNSSSRTSYLIEDCIFENNTATYYGCLLLENGTGEINNTDIIGNSTTAKSGSQTAKGGAGGIYVRNSMLTLTGSKVNNNTSYHGAGIVIDNRYSTVILNEGTEVSYNESTLWGAGGVLNYDGTLAMNAGSKISNNTVVEGGAGVLLSQSTAVFNMNGGEIYGNVANFSNKQGGAAILIRDGKFTMNGGEIYGNDSKNGAAIANELNTANVALNGGEIYGNTTNGAETTTSDINLTGITVSVNVENIVSSIMTKSNLSFGYEKDEDDNYSFYVNSNGNKYDGYVGLRFAAMVPMSKWNMINNNITTLGVAYSNTPDLSQAKYASQEVSKVAYVNEDGTGVGNAYAAVSVRIMVPETKWSTQMYYGIGYVIEKDTDTPYYFGPLDSDHIQIYSVKSLSQKYIGMADELKLSENTLGALNYLAR